MQITPEIFEQLLPLAASWAAEQEAIVLKTGEALNSQELEYASKVGVSNPEKVRLLKVPAMPRPTHPILSQVADATGLLSPAIAGLTLRYAIFVRNDYWRQLRLITHELAHTHQYERLGGFSPFLRQYLQECFAVNYPNGALEQEARNKEKSLFDSHT